MNRRKIWKWVLLVCVMVTIAGLSVGCKTKPPEEEEGDGAGVVDAQPTGPFAAFQAMYPGKEAIEDWSLKGEVRLYLSSALAELQAEAVGSELAEGLGAETAAIFESYGYRMSGSATYERPAGGEDEIVSVWIHEMSGSNDAFGIFSVQSAGDRFPEIGLASRQTSNTLGFVKGPYFVSLSYKGLGEAAPTLKKFGNWIADRIDLPGRMPLLVSYFPSGADQGAVQYFHTFSVLNALPFVPKSDPAAVRIVLGLSNDTDVAIVGYAGDEEGALNRVFAIRYLDQTDAMIAFNRYKEYLDSSEDPEEQKIALAEPVDGYLVGTLNAEEESVQPIIPQVLEAISD